jgi:hypothetical protein
MRRRRWYVQAQLRFNHSPENVHFSLHPGNARYVDLLLADLREAVTVARAKPVGRKAKAVKLLFAAGAPRFSDAIFRKLLSLAGIKGNELPGDMADINEILNSLPRDFAEKLLTAYINELYSTGASGGGTPDEADAPSPPPGASEPALDPRLERLLAALPPGGRRIVKALIAVLHRKERAQ